jgi:hypothetical protein
VVIGRRAPHVSEAERSRAWPATLPLNDVTARDLQKLDVQFTRAKGFDTFCPVGDPRRRDDWRDLEVICRVNGTVRQHGHASDMVFGVPALIAYISRIMTLEPGDIIATGTPEGVGPLRAGDIVEVEIPGVGTRRNPVRAASHRRTNTDGHADDQLAGRFATFRLPAGRRAADQARAARARRGRHRPRRGRRGPRAAARRGAALMDASRRRR